MKKYILIVVFICFAIFYGCGSSSESSYVATPKITEIYKTVENGYLPEIYFQRSGARFSAEPNTLQSGVTLRILEEKTTGENFNFIPDEATVFLYTLKQTLSDSYKTISNYPLEKPLTVTIPNNMSNNGECYIGIRKDENEPWYYTRVSDSLETEISSLRASETTPKSVTFKLYKLGIQLALFVFDWKSVNSKTFVDDVTSSVETSMTIKDNVYQKDLKINNVLKGVDLNNIKSGDLAVKIIYKNQKINSTSIKVNDKEYPSQMTIEDSYVSEGSYIHYFAVDDVKISSSMSNYAEFSFVINLKGIREEDFPREFTLEFFNSNLKEEILPFSITKSLGFITSDDVKLTLISDEGNVVDTENNLYRVNPTFTVSSDYNLGKIEKEKISEAIYVTNIASSTVVKTWNDNSLTISFDKNLSPNTSYTIVMKDITDLEDVSINKFDNFKFTTGENRTNVAKFSISPDSNAIIDYNNKLYSLNPSFIISSDFDLTNEEKSRIEKAISVSTVPMSNLTKTWYGNSLTLGFNINLETNNTYSISMEKVDDLEEILVTPFADMTFSTIGNITIAITDRDNIFDEANNLYKLNPSFVITPGFAFNETDKVKILNAINVSNIPSDVVNKIWEGNNIKLTFNQSLAPNSIYTISMGTIIGLENLEITAFTPLTFKTADIINLTLSSYDSDIFDTINRLYRLNPTFTISSSININKEYQDKIKQLITVSNIDSSKVIKSWNNNVLILKFSENLAPNKTYTISLPRESIKDEANIAPFGDFNFTTMWDIGIKIEADSNSVFDKENNVHKNTPSFTVTSDYEFTESDKDKIKNSIFVSNVESYIVNKTWNGNKLSLTFKEKLPFGPIYTISMSNNIDINGVSITPFNPISFVTMPEVVISLEPNNSNIVDETNNLYKLNPEFTITSSYNLGQENMNKILEAIKVKTSSRPIADSKLNKNISESSISLSFKEKLTPATSYIVYIDEIQGLDGITINTFDPYSFATLGNITWRLNSRNENIYDQENQLFWLNPIFTITPSFNITSTSFRSKIADYIYVSNVENSKIIKNWENDNLVIRFDGNLATETIYTIHMEDGNNIEEMAFTPFNDYEFRTMGSINVELTSPVSNIAGTINGSRYYKLNPTFTVTSDFEFDASAKAKIKEAIRIVGDAGSAERIITKNWSDNTLNISFSENLNTNKTYVIEMSEVTGLNGYVVAGFDDKDFDTLRGLNLRISGDDLEMVLCPPGTFLMGSPEDELGRDGEEVQHNVTLTKPFYIAKAPITMEQYYAHKGVYPHAPFERGSPAVMVSFDMAKDFCELLNASYSSLIPTGYRFDLPTEAQWEYACRAGTTTSLNSGKNITSDTGRCTNLDDFAWYTFNNSGAAHAVKQKKPNSWGLYDMHGNVWEWCNEIYDGYYSAEDVVDPKTETPSELDSIVIRGGSYDTQPAGCRSATRLTDSYDDKSPGLGFRVILVQDD